MHVPDLAYRDYAPASGQAGGDTIVILHGLFGSGRNWHGIAAELARERRVVTVDLRNHGQSPREPAMDYPAMAADVERVLDTLGLADATLVGHSMGGKVAMTLALAQPRRCARLVVVDIAPVTYPDRFSTIIATLRGLPLAELAGRAQADALLATALDDAALRAFLLANLEREENGWRWRVDLAAIEANLPAIMTFPAPPARARYEGPALFLRGGASAAVLPDHEALIRGWFPRAAIETLEGAGHWPHVDRRPEFLASLTAFLDA